MPDYPSRVSRAGIIPKGEDDPLAQLRALAVNAAHGDAAALRRVMTGTGFEFVADAAAKTADAFERRVDAFLAGAVDRLSMLSPGVRPPPSP